MQSCTPKSAQINILSTLCGVQSAAMFCFVLSPKFRIPIGLHSCYWTSGTFQTYLIKYRDWPDATQYVQLDLVWYHDSTEAKLGCMSHGTLLWDIQGTYGTRQRHLEPPRPGLEPRLLKPQRLIFYTISENQNENYIFSHFRGKNLCLFEIGRYFHFLGQSQWGEAVTTSVRPKPDFSPIGR